MLRCFPNRVPGRARVEPTRRGSPIYSNPDWYSNRSRRKSLQHEVLRQKARSEQYAPGSRSSIATDDGWRDTVCCRSVHIWLDFEQGYSLDWVCHASRLCALFGRNADWRCRPCIGAVLLGAGFLMIFQASLNYIIDTFQMYAASAVAAVTALRSIFGAVFPLFAAPSTFALHGQCFRY